MKILIESRRVDLDPVPAFRSSFTNNQVRNDAGPGGVIPLVVRSRELCKSSNYPVLSRCSFLQVYHRLIHLFPLLSVFAEPLSGTS